ncbi:hypothetical protein ACED63_20440 [Vibrio splendidus]|uniref:hypothetical protein n=1 Tax=Vibrio splendidus TaxID=29497 RepID=UPI00352F1553
MFKFNMALEQNFGSFICQSTGKAVLIDSFDNREFDVRVGTLSESRLIGTISAESDEELNHKLSELVSKVDFY